MTGPWTARGSRGDRPGVPVPSRLPPALRRGPWRVIVKREDGRWAVRVPELRGLFAEVQGLDSVEAAARRAIARLTETDPAGVEVTVGVELGGDDATLVNQAVEAREAAAAAAHVASEASRAAVRALAEAGLTVRDIGTVLSLSHQRVCQLRSSASARGNAPTA
jgi:hypothetical protein